jgi:hypothetical protein
MTTPRPSTAASMLQRTFPGTTCPYVAVRPPRPPLFTNSPRTVRCPPRCRYLRLPRAQTHAHCTKRVPSDQGRPHARRHPDVELGLLRHHLHGKCLSCVVQHQSKAWRRPLGHGWLYTCFWRLGAVFPRLEPIQSTLGGTLHTGHLVVQNEPRLPLSQHANACQC